MFAFSPVMVYADGLYSDCDIPTISPNSPASYQVSPNFACVDSVTTGSNIVPSPLPRTLYGVTFDLTGMDDGGATPDPVGFCLYIDDVCTHAFTVPKSDFNIQDDFFLELPTPYTITSVSSSIYLSSGNTSGFPYSASRLRANYGDDSFSDLNWPRVVWHWAAVAPADTTTRIISMTPENGTTTSNPITFDFHGYINPDDVGSVIKINIKLENIDQNVLFLGGTSYAAGYIDMFDGIATTTGDWYYSTTTYLGDGNYRFHAVMDSCATVFGSCIFHTTLGGVIGGGVYEEASTQFIVGEATFIGNISQNVNNILGIELASTSPNLSVGEVCWPIKASDTFGFAYNASSSIAGCLGYLFVPDASDLRDVMENFKDGFLTRVPWGYATRFFSIVSGDATSTLPVLSVNLPTSTMPSSLAGKPLINVDPWEAFSESSIWATSEDVNGNTMWESLEPYWNIVVLFAFAVGAVHELIGFFGGGRHDSESESTSISTPEVLSGGRKTGITHMRTIRHRK